MNMRITNPTRCSPYGLWLPQRAASLCALISGIQTLFVIHVRFVTVHVQDSVTWERHPSEFYVLWKCHDKVNHVITLLPPTQALPGNIVSICFELFLHPTTSTPPERYWCIVNVTALYIHTAIYRMNRTIILRYF
jgi:hypothetical protein